MRQQKGMSMLEVLVSLMIVSIASIGILKLQWNALLAANSSYFATIAIVRLESLNSLSQNGLNHVPELIHRWQQENKRLLPEAESAVQNRQIRLSWLDPMMHQRQTIMMNTN